MDALPPSLPNAGLPPAASAANAGLAILLAELSEALAQAIAKMPANTPLTALVTRILPQPTADATSRPPPGLLVEVGTPNGSAQIRLPPQIQAMPGTTLDISVSQPAGAPPQARLLAVDDRPVTPGISPAPAAPASTPAPPTATAAATVQMGPKPPPSPGIPATLVTSSDPALPSGTTLLVRIAGLTPPQPEPEEPLIDEAIPEPVPAPATVPAAPGSAVSPPPTSAPSPAPTEVSGQVLPNTDDGKPLVRTPIGLLALDTTTPQSLPPDTQVTLQVIGKPVPPPPLAAAPPMPDDPPDRVLPKRLTQLIDAAQAAADDDKLADAVRERIPAPGPKLAAQLLSAMASADQPQGLARLLGDGLATALSHAAPQALDALARHWEAASTPVQGPAEGDWRSLMIPFMMNGQIANLRLTVRQRKGGRMAAVEREKGTRFLLDLDLSRLGPMQFDGLVKRQHKRFDLIIRTRQPLSGEMRRDIDALFLNGLLNFGLEGSVAFKADGHFVSTPRLTGAANGIIFA